MGHTCSKLKVVVHPSSQSTAMLDYGSLTPHGIYTSNNNYDIHIVRSLIRKGQLAPFYEGVNEPTTNANSKLVPYDTECPICFLYYPSRMNRTRCCNKSICTECFLQLQKNSTVSHCPFCVQPNLGVLYIPPVWSKHFISFKKRRADLIDSSDDNTYNSSILIDTIKSSHEEMNHEKRSSSVGTTRRRRVHLNTTATTTTTTTTTTTIQFTRANQVPPTTIYQHLHQSYHPSTIRNNNNDVYLEDILVMEAIRLSYLTEEEAVEPHK
ncbi:hypothetical protein BDF20DRAFT_618109 [Mycotypha africana]|uniref:uncharacterized protein n=1 Tax=Mycotypha africana TaxID=64632 RepID=UPI002301F84E|nr:uncharacterized protein BDF20DRAFT_618109 [Mycotypha africana]KAI8975597.1 hypothetical protein BDF20DRAFT_618109 [Mycotypha africana]